MYTPAHFSVDDPARIHRIVHTHPLGMLVTATADGFDANHIPFEFDPARGPLGTLTGHVARANPVWRQCPTGSVVMVVFRGSEGYISPNWYPTKHETHRLVPTWNYEVVHAHGRLTVRDDERFVRGVVARLTRRHEADEPIPWKMGDSPADHIDSLVASIVGIEIEVTRFEAKSKLSQNREPRDRRGAVDELRRRERDPLADAMAKAGGGTGPSG